MSSAYVMIREGKLTLAHIEIEYSMLVKLFTLKNIENEHTKKTIVYNKH